MKPHNTEVQLSMDPVTKLSPPCSSRVQLVSTELHYIRNIIDGSWGGEDHEDQRQEPKDVVEAVQPQGGEDEEELDECRAEWQDAWRRGKQTSLNPTASKISLPTRWWTSPGETCNARLSYRGGVRKKGG
jgi:hypothetical protein